MCRSNNQQAEKITKRSERMRVILQTGGKTVEEIIEESKTEPNAIEFDEEDAKLWKQIQDRWAGAEVELDDEGPHHFLLGWPDDIEIEETMKEALYLIEQDPMVGRYIDDRETFDFHWDERTYDPCGLSFQAKDFRVIEENTQMKYMRLCKTHPWLETKVLAHDAGEGTHDVEFVNTFIMDYVIDDDGGYLFRTNCLDLVDAAVEHTEEQYPELSDEEKKEKYIEARKETWKMIRELSWRRAIFLEVAPKEEKEDE